MRSFYILMLVAAPAAAPAAVDFVKDIQPILAERCFGCHGPRKQEAGLRLDHKPSALAGGDSGVVIKPGHGADSLMVHALKGTDPKLRMPRKGDPLTAEQIGLIQAWIDAGAAWPESASAQIETKAGHWAFEPVVKPDVPKTSAHPVDAFILERLNREGLTLAAEAAPTALIRRLYLDLIGLPPTPEQVQEYLEARAQNPDGAWKLAVEKLLSSPHYGERWGRHWLDAARYADSNGYEKDPMRFIWFYRDWVISAFNRDLPYDRFIIEQLAGDQLPNATQDQIVATGFLRNSMINEEGGVDPEQFRMEAMFDRMDTLGRSVLGLTIGCTQCHTHKYDPITHEEYYRMFAFLNNDNEPWRVVYTAQEQMQRAGVMRRVRELEEKLKHEHPDWEQRVQTWAASVRGDQPAWRTLQAPFIDDTTGGQKMLMQKDGSYLAQSYAPTRSMPKFEVEVGKEVKRSSSQEVKAEGGQEVKVGGGQEVKESSREGVNEGKGNAEAITAFRLELMNDPNLPAYGPGRSVKGTAALTEFVVEAVVDGKSQPLKFIRATADFGEAENTPLVGYARDKEPDKDKRVTGPVAYAIDGNDKTAWGTDAGPGRRNQPRKAVFVLEKPLPLPAKLSIGLSMKHGGWNSDDLQTMNIGRFRISCTTAANPVADPLPARVRELVEGEPSSPAGLFAYFRTTVPEWKAVNDQIELAWKEHPEGTTTLVLDRRAEPRMTSLLKRGDFLKPGNPVSPGVPAFLNPLPKGADGSRLTFARWMVDRRSPTTARAFVNRVWQAYFGTGLVETPEDFGTQGSPPSHPGLLDWLAAEFMDKGWRIKDLHRLIVTSATYRQDSKITAALLERDPYNRLLARGPRFRVEGEVVRDIQLAVSGLLNTAVGGRGVMPPAPAHLFEKPASYAPFPWKVDEGSSQFRRAVYVFRRRSTPYPFLTTFDVPNGETACVRRVKSNTPLQALMTLNETMSMEAAKALAGRMVKEGGGDDAARIAYGFKLCTARAPTEKESGLLLGLLDGQKKKAAAEAVDPYTIVARVLLNLDETITKE